MKKSEEEQRLSTLFNLEIMDTDPDSVLDSIVKLASKICDTPISLVSLVDDKRQWFKAKTGLDAEETPREWAFCAHAIENDDPFVVHDSRKDDRFKENPLVTGEPHVIFYAGIPLKIHGQDNIGTLCVIDNKPKTLTEDQLSQLELLAKQASDFIETRKKLKVSKKLSEMLTRLNNLEFESEKEINQILTKYLQTGAELYGLEFGIISHITGDDYIVHSAVSPNGELEVGGKFNLPDTYCDAVVKSEDTVTYNEVGKIPELSGHPVYVNMKLESYISTPIWYKGSIFGTLNYSSLEPRKNHFIDEERKFIEILADAISKKMAIEERNKRLKHVYSIMNEAPEYIGMADLSTGKTVFHNKAFNEVSGIDGEAGLEIKNFHPDWAAELVKKEAIPHAIDKGPWKGETAILNEHGHEIPVLQTIVAHKDHTGAPKFVSTVMQDIRKQKEIEDKLSLARQKAEEANNLKSEFLASVSHEIRTPLNGVLGMVNLLNETSMNVKQREMVGTIHSCGSDLLSILNDILDLSKIESGKMIIESTDLNLKNVIDESAKLYQSQADEKGIEVKIQTTNQLPNKLIGDPVRIKQILNNFISNAIKFTDSGTIEISTNFATLKDNSYNVQISVKDSGIGISPDKQEKIFGAFEQADNSTTRMYGGTGLGLSICCKLAKLMDGQILLTSKENEGSTFTIELPLKANDQSISTHTDLKDSFGALMSDNYPYRILVAEDNLINQKLTTAYLKKLGYSCDIAENGQEAIDMHSKNSYDLIFMDMQMPVLDGIGAAKEILASDDRPLIVAMTANSFEEDKEKCAQAGMVDFISKPFEVDDLKELILRVSSQNEFKKAQ